MRSIRIQRADRFKLNFKEYLMRALKNDPLDHFLICMATKLMLRCRPAFVKCSGPVRTKFKLRPQPAFTKCSTHTQYKQRRKPLLMFTYLYSILILPFHRSGFLRYRKSCRQTDRKSGTHHIRPSSWIPLNLW